MRHIREKEFKMVPDEWTSTWNTGVNHRTLERYLSNGWVDMERRDGKRWWRKTPTETLMARREA